MTLSVIIVPFSASDMFEIHCLRFACKRIHKLIHNVFTGVRMVGQSSLLSVSVARP